MEYFITKMEACTRGNGNSTKCRAGESCFINQGSSPTKAIGPMINSQVKDPSIMNTHRS